MPKQSEDPHFELMPLQELLDRRHPDNAKDHNLGLIVESIKKHGLGRKPSINEVDGKLLYGHGTSEALDLMFRDGDSPPDQIVAENGIWLIPVERGKRLPKKLATSYRLVDNKATEAGGWLEPKLLEVLSSLDDLSATGFDGDDVDRLFQLLNPNLEEVAVSDEAEKLQRKWKTKSGQLWEIGRHRMMCGDSSITNDVARLMGGEKANLVFTDPPYNVASHSRNFAADKWKAYKDLSEAEWDKNFDIGPTLSVIVAEVLAEDCAVYVCTSHWLVQEIWEWMWAWSDFCSYAVWCKPNPAPALSKRHWTWATELIPYAVRGKHVSNFPEGTHALNWWAINKRSHESGHPTEKPIDLPARAIKFSSNWDGLIADLFLGSGTTMVAAEQLNRTCYGMEIEPKYVAVTLERMSTMGLESKLLSEA